MLILTSLSIAGSLAGLLLLRVAPTLRAATSSNLDLPTVSVIIPARNEAANLPRLLDSLRTSVPPPVQIIVVDDHSTDSTAAIAASYGVTVIPSAPLPAGWTGKTWACRQGALATASDILFFLDADTYLASGGYASILGYFAPQPLNTALSILPFHRTERWYEELSVFFNIVVAMGAGGFGKLDAPHLFGPSLILHRQLYLQTGGHEAVRGEILENLHFAQLLRAAGGELRTFAGRSVLETRMFPGGFAQLRESWTKAFAAGAAATSPLVLVLSVVWLAAAMFAAIDVLVHPGAASFVLYLLNCAQIFWYARQLGTYRLATALLYPLPLAFYFAVFAQSLGLRRSRRPVTWRGRRL